MINCHFILLYTLSLDQMCAGSFCFFVYLVKQWAVCNRKPKGVKTHPQYHIIRSIVTVAFTAACQESEYSLPAEHHSITQGQRVRENNLVPDSYASLQNILKPYPKQLTKVSKCPSIIMSKFMKTRVVMKHQRCGLQSHDLGSSQNRFTILMTLDLF